VGDVQTLRELLYLKTYLKEFNGQPIAGVSTRVVGVAVTEKGSKSEQEGSKGNESAFILKVDRSVQLVKESGFREDRGKEQRVVGVRAIQS
jgi:hypothetical protein